MKAVLLILAATVLLGIFAIPTMAELELSVDFFWGNGESRSDPADQEDPEPELEPVAQNKVIVPTPEPTPEPTYDPEPTPEPTYDPEPTDDPEPTPEPTPNPNPIPLLKQRSDLNGLILGLRYPFGRFRPSLELGTGKEKEDSWKEDFRLLDLKAGYAVIEGEKGRIEPYLGYLNLEAGGFDISGPMLGIDFRYHLTPKFSLDGGAGYSFDPSLKKDGSSYHNDSLKLARIKFLYHLNERWDLGLGYRVYRFDGDTSKGIYSGIDAEYELATLGFTVKLGAKPKPEPPAPEPKRPEPEPTPEPKPEPKPEAEPEASATPLPVVPVPEEYRSLKPIFFDFDKSNLRNDQIPNLDQNIAILKDHPDLYILVAGHADYRGSIDYNVALSNRRAKTVTDYLVKNGINPERITLYAYGETYPYNNYDSNPNWESDRWVDILVSELPPSREMGIDQRGVSIDLK